MLFNSPVYIFLFLPPVVVVYFLLNRQRWVVAARIWLVGASLFFYGYWNPAYLLLIVSSIAVNFLIGLKLQNMARDAQQSTGLGSQSKALLWLGIAFNLGLIGYYKYADFFIVNLNALSGAQIPLLQLLLPLAISFFTFQQIAYLVDCYEAKVSERDILRYSLFVTFFPQLIAGPIVHHQEMMPQFKSLRAKLAHWKHILTGCMIFSLGLFKKVAIADTFATWADPGFALVGNIDFFTAWGTSLSYSFQLYYDFSGYSDMAIGAALMMNIHLPSNFESPYKARGIQQFWRCWHMTLSRWLKAYLYIPLGGNQGSSARTHRNLLATFVLGGLWHGAGWTFLAWGLLHGLALIVQRLWRDTGCRLPGVLAWLVTFLFLNASWVVFRAESLESAQRLLSALVDLPGALQALQIQHLQAAPFLSAWTGLACGLALVAVTALPNSMQLKRRMLKRELKPTWARLAFAAVITAFSLSLLYTNSSQVFLYFNF